VTLESQLVRTRRNLQTLDPRFRPLAEAFIVRVEQRTGERVLVHQARRTWPEQAVLFAQGRTTPGKKVTNAEPGESYHNYGLAFDYCFLNSDGSPNWNVPWEMAAQLALPLGLDPGALWPHQDLPHIGLVVAHWSALKRVAPDGFLPAGWTPPPKIETA